MDRILAIARQHRLLVIEDAAQAHGSTYKGKKVGGIGDMGIFSFQASKNLPAGEGGMFVTNREELKERANRFRMFGEDVRETTRRPSIPAAAGRGARIQFADDGLDVPVERDDGGPDQEPAP
jgi:dTDP-4-amino-4,6-dideoxygalactose transaminase